MAERVDPNDLEAMREAGLWPPPPGKVGGCYELAFPCGACGARWVLPVGYSQPDALTCPSCLPDESPWRVFDKVEAKPLIRSRIVDVGYALGLLDTLDLQPPTLHCASCEGSGEDYAGEEHCLSCGGDGEFIDRDRLTVAREAILTALVNGDPAEYREVRSIPFAQGGVVHAVKCSWPKGTFGKGDEPEAIIPLVRDDDGKLTVREGGAAAPTRSATHAPLRSDRASPHEGSASSGRDAASLRGDSDAQPTRHETVVAIDFDGTVVMHRYPEVGRDNPGAVETLRELVEMGVRLVLFTMRSGEELKAAVRWFDERDLPLYGVNVNPRQRYWTESPKAYAQRYIDDAALGAPLFPPDGETRLAFDWNIGGPVVVAWAKRQLERWEP